MNYSELNVDPGFGRDTLFMAGHDCIDDLRPGMSNVALCKIEIFASGQIKNVGTNLQ